MAQLSREQMLAVGGLGALLLVATLAVAATLQMRADALENLTERHERLEQLEARVRSAVDPRRQNRAVAAPAPAWLDAPTSGLATAVFQAYLAQRVTDQHAVLVSSAVAAADRDDKGEAIRLQITLNARLSALQALLYQLESGVPYVFVDALSIQPGSSGERAVADPLLKVNLTVHALWHRGTA
jgi:general secretion pathway protein M